MFNIIPNRKTQIALLDAEKIMFDYGLTTSLALDPQVIDLIDSLQARR
jgi:hypothetical protein